MFRSDDDFREVTKFIAGWAEDAKGIKGTFIRLKEKFFGKNDVTLSFICRPGISHSLRVGSIKGENKYNKLFALMDIVDDQIEGRWLSVCFYSELVTDPDQAGNLVPNGILGEDGYCFDVLEYEESLLSYVEQRIDEAYEKASRIFNV
ncbi:conserved hypothetical protein [uncultured Desulfobacterium sp.]|uniref:Uncharacterized protein n=1 Tax=uncultured Desulfobacterium sp. TaxID=201089 RepID=A0A445MU26_9BACT|nr:conserved hypothetical protein [uncultured Desulfobacterium sp.]